MTDFELLYSKFNFKPNEAEQLRELHGFATDQHKTAEPIMVSTIVTDSTGTKVQKKEVQHAKLV